MDRRARAQYVDDQRPTLQPTRVRRISFIFKVLRMLEDHLFLQGLIKDYNTTDTLWKHWDRTFCSATIKEPSFSSQFKGHWLFILFGLSTFKSTLGNLIHGSRHTEWSLNGRRRNFPQWRLLRQQ